MRLMSKVEGFGKKVPPKRLMHIGLFLMIFLLIFVGMITFQLGQKDTCEKMNGELLKGGYCVNMDQLTFCKNEDDVVFKQPTPPNFGVGK